MHKHGLAHECSAGKKNRRTTCCIRPPVQLRCLQGPFGTSVLQGWVTCPPGRTNATERPAVSCTQEEAFLSVWLNVKPTGAKEALPTQLAEQPRHITPILSVHGTVDIGGTPAAYWWLGRAPREYAHPTATAALMQPNRISVCRRVSPGNTFDRYATRKTEEAVVAQPGGILLDRAVDTGWDPANEAAQLENGGNDYLSAQRHSARRKSTHHATIDSAPFTSGLCT